MSKLDPKDVELFLLENLNFFETRESLVSELKFKHAAGSASSLLERQVTKLRDEHKSLISLLNTFIKTASINEDLFNKSKDLTLKILGSKNKKEIIMGYKLKTHSSAKKRFKATGSGLKRRSASRAHILTKQTTKRKRHNRGMIKMADETKKIAQKLLYNI